MPTPSLFLTTTFRLFLGIRKESLSLFSTLSLRYLLLGIQLEYLRFLWELWLNCRWVILHFNHLKVSPVGYPIRDYLKFLWDFLVNLPLDYPEQLAASFLGVPKVLCVSWIKQVEWPHPLKKLLLLHLTYSCLSAIYLPRIIASTRKGKC